MAGQSQNASACGAVCPLVCIVPATMSQAGMGMTVQQPMQMGMAPMMMVAPMTTQVMMPFLDASCSAGFGSTGFGPACFGTAHVGTADATQSWPVEVPSWPVYYADMNGSEEAPQQLPMGAVTSEVPAQVPKEPEAEPSIMPTVEVPAQLRMMSSMAQTETTMDAQAQRDAAATGCLGTLRHRRGQEHYGQSSCAKPMDLPNAEEHEDDTDAKARELADSLLVQMQAGGEAHWAALGSFERLAFANTISSRAAQMILEDASMNDKVALASGLRGHVRSAVQSKHANHVVQKITEVMPVARAEFIIDELKGFAYDVARHMFGCRVFCRILEHLSPNDLSTIELVEEIFVGLDELCFHSYGSFVARHLLEFGLPEHRHQVVQVLRKDLAGYTKHKFGSHVVEAALRHASVEDRQVLARELLADKDRLMALAANQFGRHVVRALVSLPDGVKKEALDVLRPMEAQLKASRYGKSVFQAVRAAA